MTVTKPHIFELDLHHEDRRELVPVLSDMFWHAHEIAAHCNGLRPELGLKTQPSSHTLKVQCNTGGGAFPWHHDNPGRPGVCAFSSRSHIQLSNCG